MVLSDMLFCWVLVLISTLTITAQDATVPECPKVQIPYTDYTPIHLSPDFFGTEQILEAEIHLFPPEYHNHTIPWTLKFEVRDSKDPRLSRVATVDINWTELFDQLTMVCVRDISSTTITFPWSKRLMVASPPIVMKLKLGNGWLRAYEVMKEEGKRERLVGQHNCHQQDQLNIPHIEMYAKCPFGNCGSLASCKKAVGEVCSTIGTPVGTCILFVQCSSLNQAIDTLSINNFLRYYGCGVNSNGEVRVCCPP
ncbi:hypothetical protein Pmani_004179 [Petrolisthes manimaculis]|uniref:Clip domain-containing protein n=1 Tax=Petrolisthes manimaculis TaxID=1843537 RepID=A0AAE1UP84_9EUCA|nr:hypothetical protein Pmani_004179 [Petrolisthes manimaculis]